MSVPFTGEAGSNAGNWHESLNMASIWNLPVVFVLENNHYAVSTHYRDVLKIEDLSRSSLGLRDARRPCRRLRRHGRVRGDSGGRGQGEVR
ncbi:MAG: thiamine pyrophosphate-dependent enzyme [Acidimicrobiia bacterium]|nr:thiamine pyrophosphate-dependent enzyme [Acidimicrobiia bacterium]